jgi:hypothetical protein
MSRAEGGMTVSGQHVVQRIQTLMHYQRNQCHQNMHSQQQVMRTWLVVPWRVAPYTIGSEL